MQCRWVKLLLHGELDAVRELDGAQGEELAVDIEVEGGLVEVLAYTATREEGDGGEDEQEAGGQALHPHLAQ